MDHGSEAGIGLVAAHGHALELLEFAEEVLDEMPPLVDLEINRERGFALGPLRDDDFRTALIQFSDDPVGVECFVCDEATELCSLDQRRHPDRVVSLARQKDEAHEVAQSICQRQDFGRQAAAGLADSLALSPPFAPCP
jgi:hypothetical protein